MKDDLDALRVSELKGDTIVVVAAEAGCFPLDVLGDPVVDGENGDPDVLNGGCERMFQ